MLKIIIMVTSVTTIGAVIRRAVIQQRDKTRSQVPERNKGRRDMRR